MDGLVGAVRMTAVDGRHGVYEGGADVAQPAVMTPYYGGVRKHPMKRKLSD